jgi:hypothetical protein
MLQENEIKQIQTYCVLAGVEYYDVELELVDHMAEWVMEKMDSQTIKFEDALKQLAVAFSTEELMEIVAQKRILIRKKLLRLYKNAFLAYFKFPQIALSFLLIAFVIYFANKKNVALFTGFAMHVMNIIVIGYVWGRAKIIKENKEDLRVSLLSEKVLSAFSKYFIIPTVFYALLNIGHLFELPIPLIVFKTSLYLFPLFVIIGLSWRKINIDMHHKIRDLYPMAFSK